MIDTDPRQPFIVKRRLQTSVSIFLVNHQIVVRNGTTTPAHYPIIRRECGRPRHRQKLYPSAETGLLFVCTPSGDCRPTTLFIRPVPYPNSPYYLFFFVFPILLLFILPLLPGDLSVIHKSLASLRSSCLFVFFFLSPFLAYHVCDLRFRTPSSGHHVVKF